MFKVDDHFASEKVGPRLGTLHYSNGNRISTPTFMINTRNGTVPYITQDLLSCFDSTLLNISFPELFPSNNAISGFLKEKATNTFRSFFNIDGVVHFTFRNHIGTEYLQGSVPSDGGIVIDSRQGRQHTNFTHFEQLYRSVAPDSVHTPMLLTPFHASKKTHSKVANHSKRWLNDFLQNPLYTNIIPTIPGGRWMDITKAFIKDTNLGSDQEKIVGFDFSGFGTGETEQKRVAAIPEILRLLPATKARYIDHIDRPDSILQLISLGIDVFSTDYPVLLAEMGYALIFPYCPSVCETMSEFVCNMFDHHQMKENFALFHDCTCHTCRNYTRGYIHHLFKCQEMLATILLTIHNVHHFYLFFSEIRGAIANNHFQEYQTMFSHLFSSQSTKLKRDHDDFEE